MEGAKQCPECKCTDVPMGAEICPFCGYPLGRQAKAKPAGNGKRSEVESGEMRPEPTEGSLSMNREPANPKTEEWDKSTVPESAAGPAATEHTTYNKKGRKKQADSGVAQQGQGWKTAVGWLAAGLTVAVLLIMDCCLNQLLNRYVNWVYLIGLYIVAGVMAGFLHFCCYVNEKGSRVAGALGIIAGSLSLLFLLSYNTGSLGFALSISRYVLYRNIIRLAVYAMCWLTAARLAKNRKNALIFCLTAAELILLPYLAEELMYRMKFPISGVRLLAVSCAAMLLTDFLLYRIKAWLGQKPRKLFWVFYAIVMTVILVICCRNYRII